MNEKERGIVIDSVYQGGDSGRSWVVSGAMREIKANWMKDVSFPSSPCEKGREWSWRDEKLRAPAVLSEDLRSVPSTHTGLFIIVYKLSSRGSSVLSWSSRILAEREGKGNK